MPEMPDSHYNCADLSEDVRERCSREAKKIVAAHVAVVNNMLLELSVYPDPAELTAFAVRLYSTAFAGRVINTMKEAQQQTELPLDAPNSSTR